MFNIEDEHKLRIFYGKRIGSKVPADSLGEEWKDYVFEITGGNDKQGFPMKQGVLTTNRVRLLLSEGHSCFQPRRTGERRRKSVRGCIVAEDLSVLSLIIVRKGIQDIPDLTDKIIPRRLGPKRANKIRKLFNLTKKDDVREFVLKFPLPKKEGKKQRFKSPKIQRLITPLVLQRKRRRLALKRDRHRLLKSKKTLCALIKHYIDFFDYRANAFETGTCLRYQTSPETFAEITSIFILSAIIM